MWLIFFSYHAKSPENSGKEKKLKKKKVFLYWLVFFRHSVMYLNQLDLTHPQGIVVIPIN